MKLIFCSKYHDVRKLHLQKTVCKCGESWGQYIDDLNATFGGEAIPLGFNNYSLAGVLMRQPEFGYGRKFEAFIIPKKCETFKHE